MDSNKMPDKSGYFDKMKNMFSRVADSETQEVSKPRTKKSGPKASVTRTALPPEVLERQRMARPSAAANVVRTPLPQEAL